MTLTGEYRILRVADEWHQRIAYTVQLKKKWWIFYWWENLRDDTFLGQIIVFDNVEIAREWAKEFVKNKIVEVGK